MPAPRPDGAARHRARKRFGQNFLHDRVVIDRIIDSLSLQPDDAVVEIGPGQGALTRPLLQRLDRLQVIEIDRDLATRLRAAAAPGLLVHEADVLKFDFHALSVARELRVVGNLPYNISTELLLRLVAVNPMLRDITAMLQSEVVDRITAGAGSKSYGRLSVLLQNVFSVHRLFDVPPEAFDPVPRVQSAVIRLTPLPGAPVAAVLARLAELSRLAFANRRKTLRNNLKNQPCQSSLVGLGIDLSRRAETLEPTTYLQWAKASLHHG